MIIKVVLSARLNLDVSPIGPERSAKVDCHFTIAIQKRLRLVVPLQQTCDPRPVENQTSPRMEGARAARNY